MGVVKEMVGLKVLYKSWKARPPLTKKCFIGHNIDVANNKNNSNSDDNIDDVCLLTFIMTSMYYQQGLVPKVLYLIEGGIRHRHILSYFQHKLVEAMSRALVSQHKWYVLKVWYHPEKSTALLLAREH